MKQAHIIIWAISWIFWILSGYHINAYAQTDCRNDSSFDGFREDYSISAEKRLTKYLLNNYMMAGRDGRPVKDIHRTTKVQMMLGLINIELDESEKVLTTSMWAKMIWNDEYLTWDPSQYEGLEVARIESFNVWTPDVMLYNTAEPESKVRNSLVMTHSNGKLVWVLHQIFKSSCNVNVSDFPFDTQVCHMWFGSWTHKNHEIDMDFLHPMGIDLETFQSDYKESCEWDIIKTIVQRITPANISVLTYEIHMQRKMVFSSYILTLPCVFLAALTLVVFCLPPERPDRTGLAMNIFSSFLVLLLILVEAAPSSASSVPKLGIYYCFNMVIIMLSIFLSSLVVNIHRTDTTSRRIPTWIRLVFLEGLARALCLHVSKCKMLRPMRQNRRNRNCKTSIGGNDENMILLNGINKVINNDAASPCRFEEKHETSSAQTQDIQRSPGFENVLDHAASYLRDMRVNLQKIENYMSKRTNDERHIKFIVAEWRQLAKVLDRLFFIIYFIAIVFSLVILFPKPAMLTVYQ